MNLIDELTWRGMVQEVTEGLEAVLGREKVTAYIGFDPTAVHLFDTDGRAYHAH